MEMLSPGVERSFRTVKFITPAARDRDREINLPAVSPKRTQAKVCLYWALSAMAFYAGRKQEWLLLCCSFVFLSKILGSGVQSW